MLACVGAQLQAALSSRDAAWAGRFGGVPAQKPTRDHVLVFVGDSEDAMRAGAGAAAAAGFQRTAILQGNLAAFSSSAHMQARRQSLQSCDCSLGVCTARSADLPLVDKMWSSGVYRLTYT